MILFVRGCSGLSALHVCDFPKLEIFRLLFLYNSPQRPSRLQRSVLSSVPALHVHRRGAPSETVFPAHTALRCRPALGPMGVPDARGQRWALTPVSPGACAQRLFGVLAPLVEPGRRGSVPVTAPPRAGPSSPAPSHASQQLPGCGTLVAVLTAVQRHCPPLTGATMRPGRCGSGTECRPVDHKVAGSFPGQGTCLGCGPGPQVGVCERQRIDVSLAPGYFPPVPFL